MNSKLIKFENTKALVQMYKDEKISFGECIRKIHIIGDINYLDQDQMDNGKIEINKQAR